MIGKDANYFAFQFDRQNRPVIVNVLQSLLASILLLISMFACAAPPGDLTITEPALDSQITLKTSARYAGAVSSIVFRGKEYIDSHDPGRLLQSASSFDALGECYNPTEGGSRMADKNWHTSELEAARVIGNQLRTQTDMGFWRNPNQPYDGRACGSRHDVDHIANTVLTSGHVLDKQITVGLPNYPNVIQHLVTFHVPRPSNYLPGTIYQNDHFTSAMFEASTGYLPKEFSDAVYYNPIQGTESEAGDRQGEQDLPVILFTPDKRNAMGVYSPYLPQKGMKVGYGRFIFPDVNKWNCVFRVHDAEPGSYHYQCLIVLGTLDEVENTIQRLAKTYPHSDVPATTK